MNNTQTQQALAPLVGQPLGTLGRASNMLWIHFGKTREVASLRGGTKLVGEWAIHIQCPWRICRDGRIVVAYRDYYYSPEGDALDDWETSGKSRFDHLTQTLRTEFAASPPKVLSVSTDDVGGFSLAFSDNYRFDVFPDDSRLDDHAEHWRLFEPQTERDHFVVP